MSFRMRRKGGGGFTLIELLVVVAVIAMLVSILVPSLGKAKNLAKDMKCMTIMKGLGQCYMMYQHDFAGGIPPMIRNSVGNLHATASWITLLAPYSKQVFLSDPGWYGGLQVQCPKFKSDYDTYSQNSRLGYYDWNNRIIQTWPANFDQVKPASDIELMAESYNLMHGAGIVDYLGYWKYPPTQLGGDGWGWVFSTPHGNGARITDPSWWHEREIWYDGSANTLWCDGHVKTIGSGDANWLVKDNIIPRRN